MAKTTKKCKICGCEYEYCHTINQTDGIFRWQDVACSPEHASLYFAQIEESRNPLKLSIEEIELQEDSEYDKELEEVEEDDENY